MEYIGSSLTATSFYSILDGISKASKGRPLRQLFHPRPIDK
jgi:hypothetical protein